MPVKLITGILLLIILTFFPVLPLKAETGRITVFGPVSDRWLEILFTLDEKGKPAVVNLGALHGRELQIVFGPVSFKGTIDARELLLFNDKIYLPITPEKKYSQGYKYAATIGYYGGKSGFKGRTAQKPYREEAERAKAEIRKKAKEEVIRQAPANSTLTGDYVNSYILQDQFEISEPGTNNSYYYFSTYTFMGHPPYISLLADPDLNIIWSNIYYGGEEDKKSTYRLAFTADFLGDRTGEMLLLHFDNKTMKHGYSLLQLGRNGSVTLTDTTPVMEEYKKALNKSKNKRLKLKTK